MSKRLKGKTAAIIVTYEFENIELLYSVLSLNEEGAD
jgi:hypothetical protein